MNSLNLAVRQLVLGVQPPEELPSIATAALAAGVDSPSLRELAGTSPSDYQDARDLFLRAIEELGIDVPGVDEARWACVREWAQDMVEGRLSPIDASRRIWWQGWEELDRPAELTPFVGLASEREDDPPRRHLYEQDMLDAARRLLADGV